MPILCGAFVDCCCVVVVRLGKIVFMATSKPLVTQQIQACYDIMGIPQSDAVALTGAQSPKVRQGLWVLTYHLNNLSFLMFLLCRPSIVCSM